MLLQDPTSGYVPTIRDALVRYYGYQLYYKNEPAEREETERERALVRKVTGIKDEALFPDDKRLDAKVSVLFAEPTAYGVIFQEFTRQSGVPLDAPPAIKGLKPMVAEDNSLRTVMRNHASHMKGAWKRRGDGYFLQPQEELFPRDRRIEVSVLAYYPDPTPLPEVLRFLSESSKTKLDASPELRERPVSLAERNDVRQFMRILSQDLNATWVRRGEGYYLTRQPDEAEPAPENSTNPDADP
jgi:hypothetical protein